MRVIGHLPGETAATSFSSYLLLQGIQNEVERDDDGRFAVWIRSDDELDVAKTHLTRFRQDPGHADFQGAPKAAEKRLAKAAARVETKAAKTFSRDQIWTENPPYVTIAIVVACIAVAAVSMLGKESGAVAWLFISEVRGIGWQNKLPEVLNGELWRLVTPIFLHFGPVHLIFNMLGLLQLGSMIERHCGSRFFIWQVLVLAVTSNVCQVLFKDAGFGGYSGVLYGQFGYIWMKGRYDSGSRLHVSNETVAMALIWFVICFSPGMHVANTVHTVGLIVGAAWGYLSARRSRHFVG